MKNRKRTAELSWQDVEEQAQGEVVTVHYDGIQKSGRWYEDHMMQMFSGCEMLRLTDSDYQVTKWPDRSEK